MEIRTHSFNLFNFRHNDNMPSTRKESFSLQAGSNVPELDHLILSDAAKGRSTGAIRVQKEKGSQVNSYSYFFDVDELSGLSADEKNKIKAAIHAALKTEDSFGARVTTSDQFAMSQAQQKAQLDFVAQHLVPEPFRDQMMEANQHYIEQGTKAYNERLTKIYQELYNVIKADPSLPQGMAERDTQIIEDLGNGTSLIQRNEADYLAGYSKLNGARAGEFDMLFEEVMKQYKDSQLEALGSHVDVYTANQIDQDTNLLKERWNTFIGALDRFQDFLVRKGNEPMIDYTI